MTDSKHTPGPWIIEPHDPSARGHWLHDADGAFVGLAVKRDHGGKEAEMANARLMAAAPELLALIDKASQLASIASDWNLYEVEIDEVMVGIYDLKREFDAAIAKAEGRPAPTAEEQKP